MSRGTKNQRVKQSQGKHHANEKSALASSGGFDFLPNAIIKNCVAYSEFIAAWRVGFPADPSGDGLVAGPSSDRYLRRAQGCLRALAEMPATTASDLFAKAHAATVLIADVEGSGVSDQERDFLGSFAKEAKEFLEGICEQERRKKDLVREMGCDPELHIRALRHLLAEAERNQKQ